MPFTAKDVIKAASQTLLDADYVRWPLSELLGYLNDGMREIVALKPNANSKVVLLPLIPGSLQTLPSEYTVLSRVVRNMNYIGYVMADYIDPETGMNIELRSGPAIRTIKDRSLLDAMIPDWHMQTSDDLASDVSHVVYDMTNPRIFYVIPPHSVGGAIEAIAGCQADEIATPAAATSLDAYSAAVSLPDAYRNALVSFVCAKAFLKDSGLPASAQRAEAHMALFQSQIAAIAQGEAGMALPATVAVG